MLWKFATAFAVLACVAGPAVAQTPLNLVPQDSFGVVHLRPADLWNGEVGAKLRQQFQRESAALNKDIAPYFGVAFDEIESVTLVLGHANSIDTLAGAKRAPAKKDFEKKDFDFKDKDFDFKDKKFERDTRDFGKDKFDGFKDEKGPPRRGDMYWQGDGKAEMPRAAMKIVTTVKPYKREQVKKTFLGPGEFKLWTHKKSGADYLVSGLSYPWAIHFVNERTYVLAAPPANLMQLLDRPAAGKFQGPLAQALEWSAAKRSFVFGFNFNEASAQQAKKELGMFWRQPWRSGPEWTFLPLLEMHTAAVAIDIAKDAKAEGILTFKDAGRAAALEESVQDALALIRLISVGSLRFQIRERSADADDPKDHLLGALIVQQFEKALRGATVQRDAAAIHLKASAKLDISALVLQAKAEATELAKDESAQIARRRRICENNFKNILLGMHSFHDANRQLPPPAICDRNTGKPLLSWRVLILPYLDEAPLYNEFRLNEPWDSPHNIKLLPRMPKFYWPLGVKTKEPHSTFVQALVGPETAFPLIVDKNRMFGANGVSLLAITDGSSNTFGVVEALEAVPWTKPADLAFDSNKALPKMGGAQFEAGFHAGFMDGTVRFVSKNADAKTLRAFITRAGGELVDFDKLER